MTTMPLQKFGQQTFGQWTFGQETIWPTDNMLLEIWAIDTVVS